MPEVSDVDLVFADLQNALSELNDAITSPKRVRRCFSRFVELTQRLTSAMRKESKSKAGVEWRAVRFSGWNEVTALFKDLRNEEQHERQIYISVRETRSFELFGPGGGTITTSGVWQLTDQLLEKPPDALKMFDSDPETGEMTSDEISHCGVAYQYLLQPREAKLGACLQTIGTEDLHELSQTCMSALSEYHAFFRISVDA